MLHLRTNVNAIAISLLLIADFLIFRTIIGVDGTKSFQDGLKQSWICNTSTSKCLPSYHTVTYGRNSEIFSGTYHKSQEICRLVCGTYGALWPHPSKLSSIQNKLIDVLPSQFSFAFVGNNDSEVINFLNANVNIFNSYVETECPVSKCIYSKTIVKVQINVKNASMNLSWDTDESYKLNIETDDGVVSVEIDAGTVFGARHALETLSQMVAPYREEEDDFFPAGGQIGLVMIAKAKILDAPRYSHRGLLIDTARNYLTVSKIKQQLSAMAASKMNVLHWHATDTQSFSIVVPSVPQMSNYGAYSKKMVYTFADIQDLMEYAKVRGIRIIFELDIPSHSGNGWQWGENEGMGELVLCANKQPWRNYCIQPPCGQLNPINPNVLNVLSSIFQDFISILPKNETFHMGGDEVFFPCWNSSEEIRDYLTAKNYSLDATGFLQLWSNFQQSALHAFDEQTDGYKTPIIMWSSALTNPEKIDNYLDKDRYIIQTWVPASSSIPTELLEKGYRLIMSTKDTWYLDHGFWGITKFHTWRHAYNNILPRHDNVLGGEICMWGELVDSESVTTRIWPRAAAAAERLWSDSYETTRKAETRFYRHRERLVTRGIMASSVVPRWCYQNEGECS